MNAVVLRAHKMFDFHVAVYPGSWVGYNLGSFVTSSVARAFADVHPVGGQYEKDRLLMMFNER